MLITEVGYRNHTILAQQLRGCDKTGETRKEKERKGQSLEMGVERLAKKHPPTDTLIGQERSKEIRCFPLWKGNPHSAEPLFCARTV